MLVSLAFVISVLLAILKVMGIITTSWLMVTLPAGIGFAISLLWISGQYFYGKWADREK